MKIFECMKYFGWRVDFRKSCLLKGLDHCSVHPSANNANLGVMRDYFLADAFVFLAAGFLAVFLTAGFLAVLVLVAVFFFGA